jgi:hypothetical protein
LTPQISVHIQRLDDVVTIIDNDPNTQYIHIIDPPLNDPCPHTKVIGRVYDKYEESYTGRGAEGAIDWYAAHRDFIMSRPYVWMWVIGNELQGNRATNAEYMEQMIALLHKDGKLACGGQFSTGTPELADAPLFAKAFAMADAWSFHEYYVPSTWGSGMEGWHPWRYKKFMALMPAEQRNKPLFITEFGIDGGIVGNAEHGWKYYTSYANDIEYARHYAAGCDEYNVKCVFKFTSGPESQWVSYVVSPDQARELIKGNVKEVEEVTTPTQVRVLTPEGFIQTMDVEEYIRGVIPNEVPATWPEEALKAQAVAARTYALASKSKHAAQGYDLCSTTCCQVYSSKRDARTDAAAEATRGIVGVDANGKLITSFFSALCGGSTTNMSFDGTYAVSYLKAAQCKCQQYKTGTSGHRRGLCQWGAYAEAKDGRSYLQILDKYYNAVWRKDYGAGAVLVAPSDAVIPGQPLPEDETATDIKTLSQKVRWYTEEAVRQLEDINVDKNSYAMKIMYGLINLNDGLMYRLENKIKELPDGV